MIKSFDEFFRLMESKNEVEKPVEKSEPTADSLKANEETVQKILERCYEKVVYEAKAWEADTHDSHTIESYMYENAMLVGQLMTEKLKEMKEEWTTETYEAACEKIKEGFVKKIDEMKDMEKATKPEEK